tara:strand:- start:110 stop:478 length:369 start_codon:yes stop_codon:yes gene_type:complete
MRNGKIRRFRPRSNKHHHRRSGPTIKNNGVQPINGSPNGFYRNNTSRNPYNLEKIIEKYKNLAKEALGYGDKILHENYLQHSDHFSRILSEVTTFKNKSNSEDKEKNNQQESSDTVTLKENS